MVFWQHFMWARLWVSLIMSAGVWGVILIYLLFHYTKFTIFTFLLSLCEFELWFFVIFWPYGMWVPPQLHSHFPHLFHKLSLQSPNMILEQNCAHFICLQNYVNWKITFTMPAMMTTCQMENFGVPQQPTLAAHRELNSKMLLAASHFVTWVNTSPSLTPKSVSARTQIREELHLVEVHLGEPIAKQVS